MMIHNQLNMKARQIIEENRLGDSYRSLFSYEFLYGTTREQIDSWRCGKPQEMGGPIGDVGVIVYI